MGENEEERKNNREIKRKIRKKEWKENEGRGLKEKKEEKEGEGGKWKGRRYRRGREGGREKGIRKN